MEPPRYALANLADPWDSLEELEPHAGLSDFNERWRAFMKDCVCLIHPQLPVEAVCYWIEVADKFDSGRIGMEGLESAQFAARRFINDHKGDNPRVLSAMEAAIQRLWPSSHPDHWYEGAWLFLHKCEAAGVTTMEWWALMQSRFA